MYTNNLNMSAPTSPTTLLLPESARFPQPAGVEHGDDGVMVQKLNTPGTSNRSSRINFEGSWLDLESDDEDSVSPRMRRKNSSASAKLPGSSKNTLSNIKELTRRGSMHFRKLTNKISNH